ncbi:MAG: phosphatase PAP2 family protein [Bacteroidaceae bacterium]|nr:phosphatase PAP2 family protein [Bacteroidaceae bacterium]
MDELIRADQQLLLALNGSDSLWLDNVMLAVTKTGTWVPLILLLLFILLKNRPWVEVVLFLVSVAMVLFIADRFSSGFCKPFFHRFRPSHEPALEGLVDLVRDKRGGLYGFISSHAANTFGTWTFHSLYFRRLPIIITLLFWACLSSYSRIYLGLHYPGDILAGALWGVLTGAVVYWVMQISARRMGLSLHDYNKTGLTICHRPSNTNGFETSDMVLFVLIFAATLLFVAIYAFL